jgi:hypothetical protein
VAQKPIWQISSFIPYHFLHDKGRFRQLVFWTYEALFAKAPRATQVPVAVEMEHPEVARAVLAAVGVVTGGVCHHIDCE